MVDGNGRTGAGALAGPVAERRAPRGARRAARPRLRPSTSSVAPGKRPKGFGDAPAVRVSLDRRVRRGWPLCWCRARGHPGLSSLVRTEARLGACSPARAALERGEAGVAQWPERRFCKSRVGGSTPSAGTTDPRQQQFGDVAATGASSSVALSLGETPWLCAPVSFRRLARREPAVPPPACGAGSGRWRAAGRRFRETSPPPQRSPRSAPPRPVR